MGAPLTNLLKIHPNQNFRSKPNCWANPGFLGGLLEGNLLEGVEQGHLESPFESFPFPNFSDPTPWAGP